MTARQLYEALLIELNKENAPNILLEDFNYFANKAVYQYINKRYNIYDINQQTTDDIRVLKATAILPVNKEDSYNDLSTLADSNAVYYASLPSDYLHLLNCICVYNIKKQYKCYNAGSTWRCAATRLTSDAYSQILDNFWTRPTYKRPYYYIHNINTYTDIPTDPNLDSTTESTTQTDEKSSNIIKGSDNITSIKIGTDKNATSHIDDTTGVNNTHEATQTASLIERGAGIRYGNVSTVRLEIRYGTDNTLFELQKVYIDYVKAPKNIRLTQEEIDKTADSSQILEFPDYVCQEIINELVHLVMENISEQRLQTHPLVSQSIANPAQQQAQSATQA